VDGSTCSDAAVENVAARQWPAGTKILVFSAYEPARLMAMTETWAPPQGFYETLEKTGKQRAEQLTARASERLRGACAPGVDILQEVSRGLAKEVILEAADRLGADLIVVGSHGYQGWKRMWLGSVSHAVASHAQCSVLIVRTARGTSEGGE
jgi:nucleotide-binding universal stress UspA family protein